MKSTEISAALRSAVVSVLKEKGYGVRDISSGSGVPKLTRLELTDGQETWSCAVKITTYSLGRISFTRNADGTYKVLSDSDLIVYACPDVGDSRKAFIAMFDAETITGAFDENFRAVKGTKQEHLPMWLSPKAEPGNRFTGSGFENKAHWKVTWPLHSRSSTSKAEDRQAALDTSAAPEEESIMLEIKAILAEHMGVRPDQLEVEVRVKL